MASKNQRFSVISKTPDSNEKSPALLARHQPVSLNSKQEEVRVKSTMKRTPQLPKHIIVLEAGTSVKYKCTICSTSFKSKSNCFYHKHCGGESEKPFTCSICTRKFSTKTHFSYHTLIHSGVNPFKCRVCSKSFKTRSKLRRHEQMHIEMPKRFFCDVCSRAFLRKSSVQIHKRIHSGEKPYQCNECFKAFREKKNLIFHLSHHTGIKNWICEICGKSYSMKWDLELHKKTHSRTRPFCCTVDKCQQTFSQKRYLKRHMGIHKNHIKFICSICEKEFSRRDNLQRHIVNTHLESQNPNPTKAEKIKQLLSTAPYIKIMKVQEVRRDSEDLVPYNEKASIQRTKSVIISGTKKPGVMDFSSVPMDDTCTRISVIRTVGDVDGKLEKYSQLKDGVLNNSSIEKNVFREINDPELIGCTEKDEVSSENEIVSKKYSHARDPRMDDDTTLKLYSCEENSEEILKTSFCDQNTLKSNSFHNNIVYDSPSAKEENLNVISAFDEGLRSKNHVLCVDNEESAYSFQDENKKSFANSSLLRLYETETSGIDRNQHLVTCSINKLSENIRFKQRKITWEISDDHKSTEECVELRKPRCLSNYDHLSFRETSSVSNDIYDGKEESALSDRRCILYGGNNDQHASNRQVIKTLEVNQLRRPSCELHKKDSSSSVCQDLKHCSISDSNKSLQYRVGSDMSTSISQSVLINDHVRETEVSEVVSHFVPEFVPDAVQHIKTRCMLPKKVIAASFRDLSALDVKNSSTNVIEVAMKDNYRLLDLSMKGQ